MSYRYDRQRKIKNQRYILIGLVLVVTIFTPVYRLLFDVLERPLARAWESKNEMFDGTENFFQAWYGKKQIIQENQQLQQEIDRLKIDNLRVSYLSDERDRLLEISTMGTGLLPAHILHRGVLGNRDTLFINQGLNNGLNRGNQVFVYDNVLIGYISEVYDMTAEVTLYAKHDERIFGVLYPRESTLEAIGQGNGGFMIETPREVEAEVGDILYSMNEGGSIIAIVRDIVFDPRDPFKQVYLSYPININQIQNVGINIQKENTIQ